MSEILSLISDFSVVLFIKPIFILDEQTKKPDTNNTKRKSSVKSTNNDTNSRSSLESNSDKPRRVSKKRSKNEVDGLSSPELDKRQKRNASVKAQSVISKQVLFKFSKLYMFSWLPNYFRTAILILSEE